MINLKSASAEFKFNYFKIHIKFMTAGLAHLHVFHYIRLFTIRTHNLVYFYTPSSNVKIHLMSSKMC